MAKNKGDSGVIVHAIEEPDGSAGEPIGASPPLKDENIQLRLENARMRAELERINAANQPIPDNGPGTIRVVLRHTPAPIKRIEVMQAKNEADAWERFLEANARKALESKKLGHFWKMAQQALASGMFQRSFQRPCRDCGEGWAAYNEICGKCREEQEKAKRELRAKERAEQYLKQPVS